MAQVIISHDVTEYGDRFVCTGGPRVNGQASGIEVVGWCRDNFGTESADGQWFCLNDFSKDTWSPILIVMFKEPEKAMMFKLKFG